MKTKWQMMAAALLAASVGQAQIPVAGDRPLPAGGAAPAMVPATPPAESAGADADVLMFLNGDRLHGTLVAVSPAGFGLRWKSGEMETPAAFSLAKLDRARFVRKGAADARTPQAQVRLSNDDALRGEIVAMEGDSLTLKTAYAGSVVLRRAMVSQVWPGKGASGAVYEEPEDISGWVMGEGGGRMRGAWTVKDGQLINGPSQYPIGRDLRDLPDQAEIQFTVATSGPYLQMCVGICSDNARQFSGNGYMFQFSGSSGYLYRRSDGSGNNNLGQGFQFGDNQGNGLRKAAVRIFLDRGKKQITLLINGQMIRQWTDPNGFPGTGKGLIFQCNDNGNRYRIGGIRAAAWDGRMPQGGEGADSSAPTDTIVLANGDKVSGKVASIKSGNVKFETSYAAMDIPVERITEIAFGKEGRQKARLNKNDVQCQFAGGGRLTLDLVSIGNEQVIGKSENFGEIKLAMTALEGILFNPWSRPAEDATKDPPPAEEGPQVEID